MRDAPAMSFLFSVFSVCSVVNDPFYLYKQFVR